MPTTSLTLHRYLGKFHTTFIPHDTFLSSCPFMHVIFCFVTSLVTRNRPNVPLRRFHRKPNIEYINAGMHNIECKWRNYRKPSTRRLDAGRRRKKQREGKYGDLRARSRQNVPAHAGWPGLLRGVWTSPKTFWEIRLSWFLQTGKSCEFKKKKKTKVIFIISMLICLDCFIQGQGINFEDLFIAMVHLCLNFCYCTRKRSSPHKCFQNSRVLLRTEIFPDDLLVQSRSFPYKVGHLVWIHRGLQDALFLKICDALWCLLIEQFWSIWHYLSENEHKQRIRTLLQMNLAKARGESLAMKG